MDPDLRAMLNQTIAVAAMASVSASGDPTWGSPAAVAARVEVEEKRIDGAQLGGGQGGTLMTTHRIYTESAIARSSRLWLPGDSSSDATLARRILQVHPIPDEDGTIHHYETVV